MTPPSQGQAANRSGNTAEQVIAAVLTARRVAYRTQYPICLGIYGTQIRADFYVPSAPAFTSGLAIESKWQDVSGSADEKLPYLVATIRQCYPCPAVIVIDGQGFRPGAIAWLRQQVDGQRLRAIYTLAEFMTWVNRTLTR